MQPRSILVIEDDHELRAFVATVLSRGGGHAVREASGGAEGISMVDSAPPDLVVTDLNMPLVDGAAVIAHLVSNHPRVNVVAMTAHDVDVSSLSGCRVLRKPFSPAVLLKAVDEEMSPSGGMRGVSLAGLLQLLAMEKSSVVVRGRGTSRGMVRLHEGRIADVAHAGERGMIAFRMMLNLDKPTLVVENAEGPPGLNLSVEHALLDSLRDADEVERDDAERTKEFLADFGAIKPEPDLSAELLEAIGSGVDGCMMVALLGDHTPKLHVARGSRRAGKEWLVAVEALWGAAVRMVEGAIETFASQSAGTIELVVPISPTAAVAVLVERRGTNMAAALWQVTETVGDNLLSAARNDDHGP